MKQQPRSRGRRNSTKSALGLPDLEFARAAVLKTSTQQTQIQFLLGQVSVQATERHLGCKQRIQSAVKDRIGIEPNP